MKEVIVFDVDGTLVNGQSQRLFIDYLLKNNIISFAFYLKLYGWFILYALGLTGSPKKIMEIAYSFLSNKKYSWVENIVDDFFNNVLKKEFFESALDILNDHIINKREVILVSNIPDILLKRIAKHLNIQKYFGTTLETQGDKFTGRIIGNIMYGDNKSYVIKKNILKKATCPINLWVYADHISDLPLFEIATNKFVVNPKNKLLSIAKEKDWGVLYFS